MRPQPRDMRLIDELERSPGINQQAKLKVGFWNPGGMASCVEAAAEIAHTDLVTLLERRHEAT